MNDEYAGRCDEPILLPDGDMQPCWNELPCLMHSDPKYFAICALCRGHALTKEECPDCEGRGIGIRICTKCPTEPQHTLYDCPRKDTE